jgi:hypothetical protein
MVDGLVIDSTDIKFLPRHECQKPDTKIWKIAMWGGQRDFAFLKMLMKRNKPLSTNKKLIYGRGLIADKDRPDFVPRQIIKTKAIDRYYTSEKKALVANQKHYRNNNSDLFRIPFILVKEGQHKKQITSSLIDYEAYSNASTFAINGKISINSKKVLISYFNSNVARYILFLISASWGIEREKILLNETMEIPNIIISNNNTENTIIIKSFDNILCQKKMLMPDMKIILDNENTINKELYKILHISPKEQILIEDTLKFSLDLFESGEKSIGFKRTLPEENQS